MQIYLDNAATTATDVRVLKAMRACSDSGAMNGSSPHKPGVLAAKAVERARETIAQKIQAKPEEIVFTSGGTEANNLAIQGIAFTNKKRGNHIITSQTEHASVLEPIRWLQKQGFDITYLRVNQEGLVSPFDVEKAINKKTILVSVMHANNEAGTLQPIKQIGAICRSKGVYFHSDACQSFTRTELNVCGYSLDLLSLNAHKIHGPRGIGVLYVREGTRIEAILRGGSQEHGLRPGTYNTEAIVGFAKAVEISREDDIGKMERLRDCFMQRIQNSIKNVELNGPRKQRLCNNIHLSFRSVDGQLLARELNQRNIFVSVGAACLSNKMVPSHVLLAMGRGPETARESVRISISRQTTLRDIDVTVENLREIVCRVRKGKWPAWERKKR